MSTRAVIVLKDDHDNKLKFYRHSDGYPEGTLPILNAFLNRIKPNGDLRDDLMQCAGHLILMGRDEMVKCFGNKIPDYYNWKCGFIEPTATIHADAEYEYTINVDQKTLTHRTVRYGACPSAY